MKLKLKARVNRSDARTIQHALEQMSAKGSLRKEGDEFVVEAEMDGSQCEGTEPNAALHPEKSGEENDAPCGMDFRRHHRAFL